MTEEVYAPPRGVKCGDCWILIPRAEAFPRPGIGRAPWRCAACHRRAVETTCERARGLM